MRSLIAFDPRTLAPLVCLFGLALTAPARADDKQACSAAYDNTQSLRKSGKLQEARSQAAACSRDVCAEFVRADCAKWLGEIDASQPTVVFAARDPSGHDASKVRITLDDKPWLSELTGKAVTIDPGSHSLHYELDGAAAVDDTVQIREGEKNRVIQISFALKARVTDTHEPTPAALPAKAPPPASDASPSRSPLPWIVGGVGAAGLVVFGITGALVLSDKSTVNAHCHTTAGSNGVCDSQGKSAEDAGSTVGPIATTALIVGVVGVGASVVLFVTRPPAKAAPATVGLSTWMAPSAGGLRLGGSF